MWRRGDWRGERRSGEKRRSSVDVVGGGREGVSEIRRRRNRDFEGGKNRPYLGYGRREESSAAIVNARTLVITYPLPGRRRGRTRTRRKNERAPPAIVARVGNGKTARGRRTNHRTFANSRPSAVTAVRTLAVTAVPTLARGQAWRASVTFEPVRGGTVRTSDATWDGAPYYCRARVIKSWSVRDVR